MMYRLIAAVAVVLVAFLQANAQEGALPLKKIEAVAAAALETFDELITEENYGPMGFESPGEVKAASLGTPMQVFTVRLDDLQKYEAGADPDTLLSGGKEVTYPVLVGGKVRSSITAVEVGGNWEAVSFGGSNLAKGLSVTRDVSAESTGFAPASYFEVRVPALNLHFLAHRSDEGTLMLTPLYDDRLYGFEAGVTIPADQVFETLLPVAKEFEDAPG
jgi:hypothetical protein